MLMLRYDFFSLYLRYADTFAMLFAFASFLIFAIFAAPVMLAFDTVTPHTIHGATYAHVFFDYAAAMLFFVITSRHALRYAIVSLMPPPPMPLLRLRRFFATSAAVA